MAEITTTNTTTHGSTGDTGISSTTPVVTDTDSPVTPPPKTFTQQELDAIVTQRLDRAQKDAERRIQDAVTEAQKLAKMNEEERTKHETEKREADLLAREQEITKRELRAVALETLGEKNIPKELADILPYSNAEALSAAIEAVEKSFRAAVEKSVTDRMRGDPPKVNTTPVIKDIPDPDKMSYAERAALYQNDRATYNKLFGGK